MWHDSNDIFMLRQLSHIPSQTQKRQFVWRQLICHFIYFSMKTTSSHLYYSELLDKAALICVTKHTGQRDKMGCAYFQHPMRVAMRCKNDDEKIVALLHDIIEDTDVTPEYLLAEGFPQDIIDGILSVTKRAEESYEDFVARAKLNTLGRIVKLHDLEDNLDIFRLTELDEEMSRRFNKYLRAHRFLSE
mgnify:CR=1 FL=1